MITSNESNPQRGESSEKLTEGAKASAREASGQIKQQASEQINRGRDVITEEINKVAHAAKAAASDLQEQDRGGLAEYVTEMANNISGFANGLRGKNVDELMREASVIARQNPALFITGSIAIGFGLSRFAKASGQAAEEQESGENAFGDTLQPDAASSASSSAGDTSWPSGHEAPGSPDAAGGSFTSNDDTTPGGYRYE